jgi:hypothetical protein
MEISTNKVITTHGVQKKQSDYPIEEQWYIYRPQAHDLTFNNFAFYSQGVSMDLV